MGRLDGMVELWAWQEGARLAAFPAHGGFVAAALFLRADCQLLTAGEDGKVRLQRAWGGLWGVGSKGRQYLGGGRPLLRRLWRSLAGASFREWGASVCTDSSQEKSL